MTAATALLGSDEQAHGHTTTYTLDATRERSAHTYVKCGTKVAKAAARGKNARRRRCSSVVDTV